MFRGLRVSAIAVSLRLCRKNCMTRWIACNGVPALPRDFWEILSEGTRRADASLLLWNVIYFLLVAINFDGEERV